MVVSQHGKSIKWCCGIQGACQKEYKLWELGGGRLGQSLNMDVKSENMVVALIKRES